MGAVGKIAAKAMKASSGRKYTVGSAGKLLGAAAGSMLDEKPVDLCFIDDMHRWQ